jgi:hypothetical protein
MLNCGGPRLGCTLQTIASSRAAAPGAATSDERTGQIDLPADAQNRQIWPAGNLIGIKLTSLHNGGSARVLLELPGHLALPQNGVGEVAGWIFAGVSPVICNLGSARLGASCRWVPAWPFTQLTARACPDHELPAGARREDA